MWLKCFSDILVCDDVLDEIQKVHCAGVEAVKE